MTKSIYYKFMMVKPKVVMAAEVTQLTFGGDYAQVEYGNISSGSYLNVRPEMMILFGSSPGLDDRGRGRVRLVPTSNILYFGWSSRASGEGEALLLNGTHITVIDLFKPWTKTPRIDDAGISYTDYDRTYAAYGKSSPVSILNCGTAVQRPLTTIGNEAVFEFDGSGSYDTENEEALASYSWGLPSGATILSGTVNDSAISFSLPEGYDWVEFVITDTQGTTLRRNILCVAGEPDGMISNFDNLKLSRGVSTKELKLRVDEYILESDYPNGSMGILWEETYTDGVLNIPTGFEHIVFVGWHYSVDVSGNTDLEGFIDNTSLTFRDIGGWLQLLPGYPIVVDRKNLATAWHEMPAADIDKYFVRLLKEYSNALELTDFTWSGLGKSRYPFPKLASKGNTIYEQVDGRAQAIACKLTSQRLGTLHIIPDPQLMHGTNADITGWARDLVEQADITESDWTSFRYSVKWFPRVNWNWGSAVVATAIDADQTVNIPTVFCIAPGKAPSQGTSQKNSGEQLVRDQDELNYREGQRYAVKMNSPFQNIDIEIINTEFRHIDPGLMKYIRFTADPENAGHRGYDFSHDKFLPIEFNLAYNSESGVLDLRVSAEPEGTGEYASTHVPPVSDPPEVPEEPSDEEPGDDLGNNIFLIHADGHVSVTDEFDVQSASGGPSWTVTDLSLDGTVLGAVADPFSPKLLGTGPNVDCWIVTSTRIYKVTDIADVSGRVITSQFTFPTVSQHRVIATERGFPNVVLVASYYEGAGVKVARTTSGGNLWTEHNVSSGTISSGGSYSAPPGIQLEFTGKYSNFSGSGTLNLKPIYGGLGVRVTVSLPAGTFRSQSAVLEISHTGSGITSCKIETREISGLGIPFEEWNNPSCPGMGTWRPMTTQDPGSDEEFPEVSNLIANGYEHEYNTNLSGGNFTGIGGWINAFRACPSHGFTGGDYVFDIVFTEINGIPTFNASSVVPRPTLHVSGKVAGKAYVGAVNSGVGDLYVSGNQGFSWDLATSNPYHDFDQALGGAFHFPWDANPYDLVYYWGKFDGSSWSIYNNNVDITPLAGYGPASPYCFSSCPVSGNEIAVCVESSGLVAIFRSSSKGRSWTKISDPVSRGSSYVGVHIADNPDIMYFWGPAGVGYSSDKGENIDSRIGNANSSEVLWIGGW
jgi:hypothetical protein